MTHSTHAVLTQRLTVQLLVEDLVEIPTGPSEIEKLREENKLLKQERNIYYNKYIECRSKYNDLLIRTVVLNNETLKKK